LRTATKVDTRTIDVVYIKAGGGHRAAAVALDAAIRDQDRPWRIRLVDLVDILDPQDRVRRITTRRPEEYYNLRLEHGLTLGLTRERHVLQAALRMGHRPVVKRMRAHWDSARVHRTSGMVIHPDFYRGRPEDRAAAMRELGLDPDRPTGLVMFGGYGSKQMRLIARRLADTQLILVCGHNADLAAALRAIESPAPRVVLGFTSEMRRYMRMCDFFIGKPGPGSISEAISQGLPVIVVRNAFTMHQERYNTEWVRENNVGVVLESFRDIREGVGHVVGNLAGYRAAVDRIGNRAVFEIPDLLQNIMRGRT
jgi:hypothetical protein